MPLIELDYFIQYEPAIKLKNWLGDLQVIANKYSMEDLKPVFNLDTAKGFQLDYIGKLVGFPRTTRFVDDVLVWDEGFWDIFVWGGEEAGDLVKLDDESYRKILKAYCSQMNAPITINNIYKTLELAFGVHDFVVVSTAGNINIKIPTSVSNKDKTILLSGVIVPPQGVTVTYEVLT